MQHNLSSFCSQDYFEEWSRVADFTSPRAGTLVENVRQAFLSLLQQISASNPAEACNLARLTVDFASEAHKHASNVLRLDFVPSVLRARAEALREANRVEEACSILDAVVSAYREICKNASDLHLYNELLVLSSSELGDTLEALGRTRAALDIRKECLIKCSEMNKAGLSDASSKLVRKALKDVERSMTRLDLADNASSPMQEFINTYGEIGGEIPELFYNFAESQWTVAESLCAVGREDEAFAAAQESISFYRTLFEMNARAFGDQLVDALWRLAEFLRLLNRPDEAYLAAQESVSFHRDHLDPHHPAFISQFVRALWRLAEFLRVLGRADEAVTTAQESVSVYRDIWGLEQPKFCDELVEGLWKLAEFLHSMDRIDDAVAACQEAVTVSRERSSYKARLDTLGNTADFLQMVGRLTEACSHYQEAVGIYRQLWYSTPPNFPPDFGEVLRKLSDVLRVLERVDEAYSVEQEAILIYAKLYEIDPTEHRRELFNLQWQRAELWRTLSYVQEASAIAQGVVTTYNRLKDETPSLFRKPFIATLWRYSNFLHASGRNKEALGACREAVDWCRVLCEDMPIEFARYLGTSLLNLACYLYSTDKVEEEALALLQERVTLYRRMCSDFKHSRSVYSELLSEALGDLHAAQRATSLGAVPKLQIVLSEDATT